MSEKVNPGHRELVLKPAKADFLPILQEALFPASTDPKHLQNFLWALARDGEWSWRRFLTFWTLCHL